MSERPHETNTVEDDRTIYMVKKNNSTTSNRVRNVLEGVGVSSSKSAIKRRLHKCKHRGFTQDESHRLHSRAGRAQKISKRACTALEQLLWTDETKNDGKMKTNCMSVRETRTLLFIRDVTVNRSSRISSEAYRLCSAQIQPNVVKTDWAVLLKANPGEQNETEKRTKMSSTFTLPPKITSWIISSCRRYHNSFSFIVWRWAAFRCSCLHLKMTLYDVWYASIPFFHIRLCCWMFLVLKGLRSLLFFFPKSCIYSGISCWFVITLPHCFLARLQFDKVCWICGTSLHYFKLGSRFCEKPLREKGGPYLTAGSVWQRQQDNREERKRLNLPSLHIFLSLGSSLPTVTDDELFFSSLLYESCFLRETQ